MKSRALCLCLSSAFLLSGCALTSIFTPGASEDYCRVNLFSDYEGIEADISSHSLDENKATMIGYCYAKRGSTFNLESMKAADSGLSYKVSTRSAPKGHSYSFKEWVGFYSDGNAIDTQQINADCKVFASFEAVKKDYLVTFKNNYQTVFEVSLKYQDTLGASEQALTSDTYSHDPENRGSDPYYMEYEFAGYSVRTEDDEGVVSEDTYANFEALNAVAIEGKTDIAVLYKTSTDTSGKEVEGTKKKFNLALTPYDGSGNPLTFDDSSNSDALKVTYNEAAPAPSKTISGYVFDHYEGKYELEGTPIVLQNKTFDANHVRYDAALKAVYRLATKSVTVNFHDKASPTIVTFEEGDTISFPDTNIKVPDGYAFAGYFTATEGSLTEFDKADLYEGGTTLDLYPAAVPARIVNKTGKKRFYYRFDTLLQGYALENFALQDESTDAFLPNEDNDVEIAATDFMTGTKTYSVAGYTDADALFARFGFVAIDSLKAVTVAGAPGTSVGKIVSFALPDSVTKILDNGMAGMSSLRYDGSNDYCLDLRDSKVTSIGAYAFKDAINMKKVILPKVVTYVGSFAFMDCEYLEEIVLPYAADQSKFAPNNEWKRLSPTTDTLFPVTTVNYSS